MGKAVFTEIKRVTNVSPTTDIVFSYVEKDGVITGMTVGEFIHSEHYTGFAKGAIFIPTSKIDDWFRVNREIEEAK